MRSKYDSNHVAREKPKVSWRDLLHDAIEKPGELSSAFSQFHEYSIRNIVLMIWQCNSLQIKPGPLATYPKWKILNRQVKKGSKAIMLCQPKTIKAKEIDPDTGEQVLRPITIFEYNFRWFVLSQTEGEPVEIKSVGLWEKAIALDALGISEIPFDLTSGNALGFARERQLAINPVCPSEAYLGTLIHEIAHIVLGHTEKEQISEYTNRNVRSTMEVESESTALLVLASLGIEDSMIHSRGYIQHWLKQSPENDIPEKRASKIFSAANKILQAGIKGSVSGENSNKEN